MNMGFLTRFLEHLGVATPSVKVSWDLFSSVSGRFVVDPVGLVSS